MSAMFHTASTVRRPGNRAQVDLVRDHRGRLRLPPSTTATLVPPMKYSQLLVRCRAVNTQLKVTVEPTDRAGQFATSASTENWASPPSQRPQPLRPLDALRLELDRSAVGHRARGAQRLAARRRGDVSVGHAAGAVATTRRRRPEPTADRRATSG